jgi:hypothetical protein
VVLGGKGTGFGEHLLLLGLREAGSFALGRQRSTGLGLNGGSQPQHQGGMQQPAAPPPPPRAPR